MINNFYESHIVPDPSRPFIYHRWTISNGCPLHWHENIELLYFRSSGTAMRDRQIYYAEPNDIVIFSSNSLHEVTINDSTRYDCLIIDSKFCVENNIDISSLDFDCLVRDETAAEHFCSVIDAIEQYDQPNPDRFAAAATKSEILSLMVYLCRNYSHPDDRTKERSDTVRRAIGYINSHISKPMTIDEIAAYVRVSKYYFCREFRRETGYTVVRYINNLRCREAERMLKQGGITVSETARLCGYDNLSYFTRTFKSVIGKTPSELRKG
ncbi:MAG: AraC family transcriptional regulator [Clostridiales bacterium]|nr:AraC family transcriptional regulator [Clostridiales bacterium]